MKIQQAGLSLTKQKFMMVFGGLGAVGLCHAVPGRRRSAAGLGRGIFRRRRPAAVDPEVSQETPREEVFATAFPTRVDVIVRGIKSGLPLLDSLKIIALEAQDPLKSEIRAIVETQTIGMPLGEACAKLYERMPLPEANFFGIVISIQQKAGGNLSEALGNLSKRAARAQKDEGQDPRRVDGGEGLRGRSSAACRSRSRYSST